MPISSLKITNFRNLTAVELTPHEKGLNIICGRNGSGKTSVLEAIYYLGHGRSFRDAIATRLIRHGLSEFSIFTQLMTDHRSVPVGAMRHVDGSTQWRVAEAEASNVAALAVYLPLRLIHAQTHHLFESGPAFRRKYLDWGLFYQSDAFLTCWRHFERALKQRNAVLKHKRPKKELDVWTEELVKHGLALDQCRRTYLDALTLFVTECAHQLLDLPPLALTYAPGWDDTQDYATVLAQACADDYRFGYTQYGPHRADIDMKMGSVSAKHFLSRGQQKLLICAMILAQGKLLERHINQGPIYLVDDLPSELDAQSKDRLITLLSQQQTQVFITAIEPGMVYHPDHSTVPTKMFHVEHGCLMAND